MAKTFQDRLESQEKKDRENEEDKIRKEAEAKLTAIEKERPVGNSIMLLMILRAKEG